MTGVFRWLRHRHDHESSDGPRVPGSQSPTSPTSRTSWKVVESVASPALGSIYVQVLRQAGIPVQVQQWGAGAGAMGGALTGVRILTPEDRFDEAREVLDAGTAGSEVTHE